MGRRLWGVVSVVAALTAASALASGGAGAAVANPGATTIDVFGFLDTPAFGISLSLEQPAPGTVTSAGSVTFPAAGFAFAAEQTLLYVPTLDDVFDVEVVVRPQLLQPMTGNVNPQTGNMALNGRMRLLVSTVGDFAGAIVDCPIGPIVFSATEDEGFAYDESTGSAFLTDYTFGVPKVSSTAPGCGGPAIASDVNATLELPVSAGDAFLDIDVAFDPAPSTTPPPPTSTATSTSSTTTSTPTPVRAVSISGVTVAEPDRGRTTRARLDVVLSAPAGAPVRVRFATVDGTAVAGSDYNRAGGTVTFARGQTHKTVTVRVRGDRIGEMPETLTVHLSNPKHAAIERGAATVTIVDDRPPSLAAADASFIEGDSGSRSAVVTITLSKPATERVRVTFATADGTARAGSDYSSKVTTVAIDRGKTAKKVLVYVKGDRVEEPDETFSVRLSHARGATIVDPSAIVRIVDDD